MNAKDVMSVNVVTVTPDDTISHAGRLMLQNRVSGLPVVDSSGKPVGMVTEGDFLRRVETGTTRRRPRWIEFLVGPNQLADEYVHAAGRTVREVMTPDVITAPEDTPLDEIVAVMEKHHIKRLPTTREGKLVGIVTRQSLLRAVLAAPSSLVPSQHDSEIVSHFHEALKAQPWAPFAVDIEVVNGAVTLSGVIHSENQREALKVLTENLPGVRSVEDQLTLVEIMSGTVIEPRAA